MLEVEEWGSGGRAGREEMVAWRGGRRWKRRRMPYGDKCQSEEKHCMRDGNNCGN